MPLGLKDYTEPMDAAERAALRQEQDAWRALEAENRQLRELVTCLIENDPDDVISDGGHTVLDLWRHDARKVLGRSAHQ